MTNSCRAAECQFYDGSGQPCEVPAEFCPLSSGREELSPELEDMIAKNEPEPLPSFEEVFG